MAWLTFIHVLLIMLMNDEFLTVFSFNPTTKMRGKDVN